MLFPARIRRSIPVLALALAAVAAAFTGTAVAAEFVLDPVWIAGGTGSGTGKYGIPESVAIDSLGQVVVTDKGRMMLHVYSSTDGRPLFDVGSRGSALGQFDRPNGIAVDRTGRIFVVEQLNRRVQIFDREYRPVGSFGRSGSSPGTFQKAMGITIHPDGSIYVTDEARADVQVFDPEGRHLWTFGESPRLARVESIEVDPHRGRIYVCDESRSLVNVYDSNGIYLWSFGGRGSGPGQFGNDPNAVRIDGRGRIYVNDQGNSRINVYDPETHFLASFRCTGRAMESADGVALSERHNLFLVADQGNDRVLAFDLGEIQCRLAAIEAGKSLLELGALQLRVGGLQFDPSGGPLWADAAMELEAGLPDGGLQPDGFGLVHVKSGRDRRGVCVRMPETTPGSGVYRVRLELADSSDEDLGRLATFEDDTLSVHFAGGPEILTFEVARYAPPRIVSLAAGMNPDGRVLVDDPRFSWQYEEDSGRRSQTAFEVRIAEPDGRTYWKSGVVSSPETGFVYSGPPLPPGEPLMLRVRIATGLAWSDWAARPLRRNAPPAGAAAIAPRDGSRVVTWPVDLRAAVLPDPDGDPVRARLEMMIPGELSTWTHSLPLLDDTVTFRPAGVRLHEDSELRWRLLLSDGFVTVPGPWWSVFRNDDAEPPRRTRDPEENTPVFQCGPGGAPPLAEERESVGEPPPDGKIPRLVVVPTRLRRGVQLRIGSAGPGGRIEVFDVRGRRLLEAALRRDGIWTWEGLDRRGGRIAPGIYWLRVHDAEGIRRHKIVWGGD